MPDTKITALAAITTVDPAADVLPIVDISDTSMAASGTTKKITSNQILGAGGTATLASATITGDLTVDTTTLVVNPAGYPDRVGIGTASPSKPLEVYNTTESTVWANTTTGIALLRAGGTGGDFYFGIDNSTGGGFGQGNYSRLIYSTGAYPIIFSSNASERYRIASDGVATWSNVGGFAGTAMTLNANGLGIGVAPSAWDTNYKALQLGYPNFISGNNGGNIIDIGVNAYFNTDWKYAASSVAATRYRQVVGVHQWFTAPSGTAGNAITWTQAMTLDASGNLLLTKTTTAATALGGVAYIGRLDCARDTGNVATFNHTTAGNLVGNIAITSTATTYNSASDYRLKEAVQPLVGGLARISALKPSVYKWKADGSNGEGFLAHELAEVVPLAVTGEKDAVNEDGSIKAQGVDLSKVVPILVAAIQELAAEVNALKNA